MIGMYGMYYLVSIYAVPYWVVAPLCILLVRLARCCISGDRAVALSPPINQSCDRRRAVLPAELPRSPSA